MTEKPDHDIDDPQHGFAADFPDLHARVQAGKMTLREALADAGMVEVTRPCPLSLDRAAAVLALWYADDIPALLDAITKADAFNRGNADAR
jgi:hypothetical protein